MGRDWNAFIKAVDGNPKEFVRAIIDYLDPPIYAKQALWELSYICGWPGCWNVRTDICFKCSKGVCDEHGKMFLGPKTELEWYVCPSCLASTPREELLKEIAEQDEEFYLEDQEAGE